MVAPTQHLDLIQPAVNVAKLEEKLLEMMQLASAAPEGPRMLSSNVPMNLLPSTSRSNQFTVKVVSLLFIFLSLRFHCIFQNELSESDCDFEECPSHAFLDKA